MKPLKIAARHSDLARLQAYRVGDRLKAVVPGLEVQYEFRASLGDKNLNDPLWKMPEKGVFTEDFVSDLLEGRADMVVHSWKDLPTEPRKGSSIVATLPRADVRDLLLFRKDRSAEVAKSKKLRILTSSPRRAYNLAAFLKDHLPFGVEEVEFANVRGNIPTRLTKMLTQDVDGIIVAKAAIDRLLEAPEAEFVPVQTTIRDALAKTHFMVLPLSINPTAAAQGALAIEVRDDRKDLFEMLAKIQCADTFETVSKERKILSSYGGGCHQKIGVNVLTRPFGEITFLRGLTDAGEVLDSIRIERSQQESRIPESAIFPQKGEALFDREPLDPSAWERARNAKRLFVARETAWPEAFGPSEGALVWTAGLATWKALASRGIWVSGSSESLGEKEDRRIDVLNPASPWLRLTHEMAAQGDPNACATYRLVPKQNPPDLRSKTHFYWMSGSAFDRALELAPEIRSRFHASGPGKTHDHICRALGRTDVPVFLSLEDFRESITGSR